MKDCEVNFLEGLKGQRVFVAMCNGYKDNGTLICFNGKVIILKSDLRYPGKPIMLYSKYIVSIMRTPLDPTNIYC